MGHGGKRKGAGRKPKADEEYLERMLKPMDEAAFKMLETKIDEGDPQAIKLFLAYRFGQPKQSIAVSTPDDLSVKFTE